MLEKGATICEVCLEQGCHCEAFRGYPFGNRRKCAECFHLHPFTEQVLELPTEHSHRQKYEAVKARQREREERDSKKRLEAEEQERVEREARLKARLRAVFSFIDRADAGRVSKEDLLEALRIGRRSNQCGDLYSQVLLVVGEVVVVKGNL